MSSDIPLMYSYLLEVLFSLLNTTITMEFTGHYNKLKYDTENIIMYVAIQQQHN